MNTAALKGEKLAIALASGLVAALVSTQGLATEVLGHLHEDVSNKPVARARVTLQGTNYSTITDQQGNFVFANVPAGSYTVSASLSGFGAADVPLTVGMRAAARLDIGLKKVAELKAITVAANLYDATSMQMNASNSINVLSADDLQHTAVHNVAEALGLIPGVNVTNTGSGYFSGIDGAARGEGVYASVRGLPADYDVNLINGVDVAQGMPYSRSVQLSLLPPSGLQTIVMNKTSTADMDGDAIGGTVDFRTPTAFDFAKTTSGSVAISGRVESRARDYGDSGLGGGAAADFQTKFGDEKQFGIYASAYYDYRAFVNSEAGAATSAPNDGSWQFAHTDAQGNSAPGYDPANNLSSTGMDVAVVPGNERRRGGNVSLDWKVDDTLKAYLRATYASAKTTENTSFTQLIPQDVTYQEIGSSGVYTPNIGRIASRYWYETNPEVADLGTVQFGADKTAGGWTISPNIFYSFGENNRPEHVEIDGREDKYSSANFAYSGSTLMAYGDHFPYPQLTPALLAQVNDIPSLYANDDGELTKIYSKQRKGGAKIDLLYDFNDGSLSSIQFGAKYTDSVRNFSDRDWSTAGIDDGVTTLGDLGIFDGTYSAIYPGRYDWKSPKVSETAVSKLIEQHLIPSDLDTCGDSIYANNYNCDTLRGVEAVSAVYAKATFDIGNLEIIPGLRFEHTEIKNTYWVTPEDSAGNEMLGYFQSNHTIYNEPLPSVFVNYRQGNNAVYRVGLWQSYTRPSLYQLGSGSQVSVSDAGVTTITEGNPNLKSIKATNFDISGQWTTDGGSYASLSGFFKHLSHYIYDAGGEQASSSTSDVGRILYRTPENGGNARVYGIELDAHQKFRNLPEPLDGLGIGFNATRQNTRADLGTSGFRSEQMQSAPKFMANAEVFYEKNGFSLDLSYHYTGAWLSQYDYLNQSASWDDLWIRPIKRLDLHVGYAFDDGLRLDFSVSNLAKNTSYWAHVGKESLTISDIVNTGMTSLLTVKYNF